MIDWQPIETAPKDRPVLLWVVFDGALFQRPPEAEAITAEWYRPGGRPGAHESWQLMQTGGCAEDADICGEPTHWAEINPPSEGPL